LKNNAFTLKTTPSNTLYRQLSVSEFQFYVALLIEKMTKVDFSQFCNQNKDKKFVTKMTLHRYVVSQRLPLTKLELQILAKLLQQKNTHRILFSSLDALVSDPTQFLLDASLRVMQSLKSGSGK